MIEKILIRIFGGIWKVKEKAKKGNFFYKLYYKYFDDKGSYIGDETYFEGIPIFPHGLNSIFISGGAKIGKNVVIFQQVTIGSNTLVDSKMRGYPTIGDNVYIGAGAKIIGNVKIGNNVRIGANAVIVKDIPDNCVVVNSDIKIIKKEKLNNKFYNQTCDGKWVYHSDNKKEEETDENILKILNKK